MVTFGETEPYQVGRPDWCTISTEQIVDLVGGRVAEDRSEGYVPPEPEVESELRFEAIGLWRLARSRPFREECMSGGTPWWLHWTNRVFQADSLVTIYSGEAEALSFPRGRTALIYSGLDERGLRGGVKASDS
ncbi:hypothetical protein OK006_9607 [Actinobacteria bacterium OK006]|nr:hypothetical protein OK006_9607 [Actinobacteria bacterium OK006]